MNCQTTLFAFNPTNCFNAADPESMLGQIICKRIGEILSTRQKFQAWASLL